MVGRTAARATFSATLPRKKLSLIHILLEMHVDGVAQGQRVVVIDDVIATGGTAKAAGDLARRSGGQVVGAAFFIELSFLKGRDLLGDVPCRAVLTY